MAKVAVLGGGSWGIALAVLLHKNGHEITVWSALEKEIEMLSNEHEHKMLPGVKLADDMIFTTDEQEAVKDKDMLVMAVASSYTRATAKRFKEFVAPGQIIVNVAKGIEEDTVMTLTEIIEQEIPQCQVAVLSGPSHAEEVAREIPTGVVAACEDKSIAEKVQQTFMNETLRVYTCPDTVGVELGAAHKNVIALCAGICDGMGYGDNTKALLMTRGLAELARLGMAMGAKRETFAGLAGVGDLIVTCTSMHSRNRRAGILIGEGNSPKEAMDKVGAVVEGYYAAKSAWELAQANDVDMPITRAAYEVLYENKDPRDALAYLMHREKTSEVEDAAWAR